MAGLVPFQKTAGTGLEGATELDSGHPWVDQIPGGAADEAEPGQFDPEVLAEGAREEMEHTNDIHLAVEIAMDHLIKDPDYYKKLKLIEGPEQQERAEKVAAAQRAGAAFARQLMKEAGMLGNVGQLASKAVRSIGSAFKGTPAAAMKGSFRGVPAKTIVQAPSQELLSAATKPKPLKIGLGKAGLLGAAGLGAYGLMKAAPFVAQAAKEEGSMPMAAGGGWSPTPYGYGYTPWGNGAPNMGAL